MKKKEFTSLKDKSIKDLMKMVNTKKVEVAKKMAEAASGKEKNLKASSGVRHEIAQILTLIKEKEILELIQSVETVKEKSK